MFPSTPKGIRVNEILALENRSMKVQKLGIITGNSKFIIQNKIELIMNKI